MKRLAHVLTLSILVACSMACATGLSPSQAPIAVPTVVLTVRTLEFTTERPIAGARVHWHTTSDQGEARTDERGEALVNVPLAEIAVTVAHDNYQALIGEASALLSGSGERWTFYMARR